MTNEVQLKIFSTESRVLEPVYPEDGKTVRMYTCGPTVYNFAHIGNFRTYLFEDLLRRTIKFFGMKVKQVMNLTDIDDKTLKGAIEQGITLDEFTATYKKAFFEDLQTLGIERAEAYPEATAYISEMIEMIKILLDKEVAYRHEGNVYFSIGKFPLYGRLSHLKLKELQTGASQRLADEYDKENASDFVLWKAYDPARDGKIFWESPFGPGRPGWHIECSAMATKLLGPSIDIHAGGVDNIFPHHENEIAQSECCTSKRFARIWVHSEHLLVDHKKMSKSLGNFYTLRDLLERGYTGRQVRFALLSTHYRLQYNFTMQSLDAAASSLERIGDFIARLHSVTGAKDHGHAEELLSEAYDKFKAALAEDLNISPALAAIFDFIRSINTLIDQQKISKGESDKIIHFLQSIDHVLGFIFEEEEPIPLELQELLIKREQARMEKDWPTADECRELILEKGYVIDDTPSGARLKKSR